jgi:hypothetical protein
VVTVADVKEARQKVREAMEEYRMALLSNYFDDAANAIEGANQVILQSDDIVRREQRRRDEKRDRELEAIQREQEEADAEAERRMLGKEN